MKLNTVICPISTEKVDSNVSRVTVLLNVLLMVGFILTGHPNFILFVAIDYSVRAFFNPRNSLIRVVAQQIVRALNLNAKLVDLAPKTFASRLGVLCASAAFILQVTGLPTAALSVTIMLATLATMDALFNFCVGCIIYNYLVFPFYKNK